MAASACACALRPAPPLARVRRRRAAVCSSGGPYLDIGIDLDMHVSQSRAYALPRVYEAARRHGMVQDPLLPRLFPPDSLEASHTAMLCSRALAEQRAALQAGSLTPPPVRRLQPTLDTPLAVRGVTLDKLVDDELLALVHTMRKSLLRSSQRPGSGGGGTATIQIVDLGCGFGTRPWSLPLSTNVAWWDVDLPAVLQEKQGLLEAAGAEVAAPPPHCDLAGPGSAADLPPPPAVPLRVGRYTLCPCHFLKNDLADALAAQGWDPQAPTIWLAFALLQYLDVRAADLLMKAVASASRACPAAAFVGTVMNAAMVDLIQELVAAAAAALGGGDAAASGSSGASMEGEEEAGVEPTATVDPESGGSVDVADVMRRSRGVQATATAIKFGVRRGVPAFLRAYGWDAVEELTPWDVEVMYGVLGVGLYYAPELRQRCKERHGGQEPVCSVGVGRRGF